MKNELKDTADVIIKKDNCDEPEMCEVPGKEHLPKDDPGCKEDPEPIYTCDALNIIKVDRDTYRFTINATAQDGAEVTSYAVNTGVETVSSDNNVIEYTYAEAGDYDIQATVYFTVDGETKTSAGNSCAGQLTVDEPQEPIYTCDSITTTLTDKLTFKFTVNVTATNGATVKHYVYSYGDGNETTTDNNTVTHTYANPGEYNMSVTVVFNVGDEMKSVECGVPIVIQPEVENCDVPGKGHLPKDSPDCYENCEIEGLTHLSKDNPRCKPVTPVTPGTPSVLPNTGAGSMVALMSIITVAGAFAHRALALRKL